MKRQRWQKAAALFTGAMLVCTLPGMENLVELSRFVRAESIPDDLFSDGEMQEEKPQILSQYSETDMWGSGDDEELFSSDIENDNPAETAQEIIEEEEENTSVPMQVSVELRNDQQEKMEQGLPQWIQVHAEDHSLAKEGEARVRVHLYDASDNSPADDLDVLLFTEKQETILTPVILPPVTLEGALNGTEALTISRKQVYQQDESGTVFLDENGKQIVTEDYLEFVLPAGASADFYAALLYRSQDETYSYDSLLRAEALEKVNERWISVLEQTENVQAAAGWTNPAVANIEDIDHSSQEGSLEAEISDGNDVDLNEEEKAEETGVEDAEPGEANAGEAETDEGFETEEGSKADETEQQEDNSKEDVPVKNIPEEYLSSILVTMTKELDEEDTANELMTSEGTKEEDVQVFQNFDTDTKEHIEESAESGQTYAVHVHAEDLHPEAKYDSVVTIHLTELATGLPATDVATAVCLSKEAALASEAAYEAELPEAVQAPAGVQNLTVTRNQETSENENGENTVIDDYLQFTLPAGSSTDFYLGLTYTTEDVEYNKQLALNVEAVQYVPIQETVEPSVSDDADITAAPDPNQNTAEDITEAELWTDETSAPTDTAQELLSAPVNIACTELVGLSSLFDPQAENIEEFQEPDAAEEALNVQHDDMQQDGGQQEEKRQELQGEDQQTTVGGVKTVNVLAGAQMLTLAWSRAAGANGSSITIYYAVKESWINNGYTIYANGCESKDENIWKKVQMEETGQKYNDLKVYKAVMPSPKYNGYDTLQFLAWENGGQKEFITAIEKWREADKLDNYIYTGSEWLPYTPFDPNDHTFFKGKTMYFENRGSQNPIGIKAIFYEKENGSLKQVDKINMVASGDNRYSVTIPETACSYVQFCDESGTVLGDTYSNFYGQGQDETEVESFIYDETSMCSYHYISTAKDSTWGTIGGRKVYYEASLSKLSYAGTEKVKNGGKPIPYSKDDSVWCYVTKPDGTEGQAIEMTKAEPVTENSHTWSDLWTADIPSGYTKIRFTAWANPSNGDPAGNGDGTGMWEIPSNLISPCFYGDTSDDVIYKGGDRGGYWDEVYTVRDAEKGKNSSVVDIPNGTFQRQSNTLYLDTTLYDYYTDYELNGNNRDNYDQSAPVGSHRIYQPFRQLNQALSDYYSSVNAEYPLYWGNFQNYDGSHFTEISDTLGLYGFDKNGSSDLYHKFFYENNSMWGRNGAEITQGGQNATQGLAAESLHNGSLLLVRSDGSAFTAPFFDESFLAGNNSKNAVLGKVYHNVSFPFVKKQMQSGSDRSAKGTVDYWYFDSADSSSANKNLQLQYDPQQEYFLQPMQNGVHGQTADKGFPVTPNGNYFPFNTTAQSGKSAQLNYGFGQKIEFKFRLTDDGTVLTSENEKVPIEFNFSGDDDVWVYIDGELVLDVGGGHDVVSGRINFRDQNAWVSKIKNNSSSGGFTNDVVKSFPDSLKEGLYGKEHTLTMFYMERGLWESNMKITFNFPDENKLQVEKVVDKTEVNSLFKDVFDNLSIFTFKIKNLATHYGTKAAAVNQVKSASINLEQAEYQSISGNKFQFESGSIGGKTNTVHWWARLDDATGSYRDQRYGTMTLNSEIDITNMQYLEFQFYYRHNDNPGLQHMYLQLVDSSGKVMGNKTDYLSGKVYGASGMGHDQWITVKIDLSKLQVDQGFSNRVSKIRFGYNWERDIYLSDFTFYPSSVLMSGSAGFVTKQYDIPDYGTAFDSKLKAPVGAQYSSTNGNTYVIGESGEFALENGETITFCDQFRRGSYLALEEEAETDAFRRLFDTSWTMYESNKAVTSASSGSEYVTGSSTPLVNVSGNKVEDGRTERRIEGYTDDQQIENNYDGIKPNDSTFVFRSYFDPDSATTLVDLKVVYTNKVNTGKLVIRKEKESGSEPLNGEYKFEVTFSDIGGMALENVPVVTQVTLKAGEETTIAGIPLGTHFSVKEMQPEDGSVLSKITVNGEETDLAERTASGTIAGENVQEIAVTTVFTNVKKPVVNASVKKVWKNVDGTFLDTTPDSIFVQLQRRVKDGAQSYSAVPGYEKIKLSPGYIPGKWSEFVYTIEGLDQYDNFQNAGSRMEYEYRFVELDADDKPVENGGFIEPYIVTEETILTPVDGEMPDVYDTTITNTYNPETTLKITKQNAKRELLGGVEFKLEKLTTDNETVGEPIIVTTGNNSGNTEEFGIAEFTGLTDGIYRLTETKTAYGYSLLKDPITVVIDRSNGCTVDGETVTVTDNTILLTVTNQKKFDIPATGSWSRYIISLSGIMLAGLATIMYLLQKRRKEGKTS